MNFVSPLIFSGWRRGNAGFTLLEVIITMCIFVLLCGAIFGLMSSVLESASSLQDNQSRRDQVDRLNAFLSKKMRELPAQSAVVSYQRGNGEGLNQNGIIMGKDQDLIAIDAKVQPNGYYTLRFAAFDPSTLPANSSAEPIAIFQTNLSQDIGVSWTPLIQDVTQLDWKFQSFGATDWAEIWNDTTSTPNLVELSMQQAGDLQPSIMDFWLPRLIVARTATGAGQGGGGIAGGGANGGNGINGGGRTFTPGGGNRANPIVTMPVRNTAPGNAP